MRLVVRDRGRLVLLDPAEIEWIVADRDYLRIHALGLELLMRGRMKEMASRLPPAAFARIHRSAIVNVNAVRELIPRSNREFVVVLRDGTRLRMSRSYRESLAALLPGEK